MFYREALALTQHFMEWLLFVTGLLPEEEGSDPQLTELSPFPLELVRHEVPVQAASDGRGLDL